MSRKLAIHTLVVEGTNRDKSLCYTILNDLDHVHTAMMPMLPDFRTIHEAIVNAPPKQAGFPLCELLDTATRTRLLSDPLRVTLLEQIDAETQRALTTPIPPPPFSDFLLFEQSGDRATYERGYFDRRRRMAALALKRALQPDSVDAAQVQRALEGLLWEICNEYTWALPAHLPVGIEAVRANRLPPEQEIDLFAAETAAALAEILALLGDTGGAGISPWLDYRIRAEVERRIFQPLFDNPIHFDWESAQMNWAAVCAGSAGIAALVLVEDRERLAGMIERVLRALESFLSGFPDDGGTAEGIVYWEYGFGFYLYFAEALHEYTAGALDLLAGSHIMRIASFPNVVALGNDRFVNFSDANARTRLHSGIGSRLAARLGIALPPLPPPDFHTDHIFRWMHISRDLLWSEARAEQGSVGDGTYYLPDLAWVVDRRTLSGVTLAFAAKGGHNDEPHNHNDLGHFILHVGDESLLADVGAGRYTRQYFGVERYASIHNGAQGHSVPVIDGALQQAGSEFAATVLAHEQRPDGVRFVLDLTRAYAAPALKSLVRTFEWRVGEGGAQLTLTDAIVATSPISLEECFISVHEPVLERVGAEWIAAWRGEQADVGLRVAATDWSPSVEVTATEDHFGAPLTVYRLLLRSAGRRSTYDATFVFDCTLPPALVASS